jgi:uncharacterized protein
MVELLIDRGAKVDARDAAGRTPLMIAAGFTHTSVVRLLLASGADPKAEDSTLGDTPLHYAVHSGDVATVNLLIAEGADINVRSGGSGATPLHYAAKRGALPLVDLLIADGAEMNAFDNGGWTPLKLASCRRQQAVVDRLEGLGARR